MTGVDGGTATFDFTDFVTPGNPLYDPTITSGDNHINLLPQLALPGEEQLVKVEINFIGTSGSVSGILFSNFDIPEPSAFSLLGLAVVGLVIRRRR